MKLFLLVICVAILSCKATNNAGEETFTNEHSADKMLLVLSAPSINETYYKKAFTEILDFHLRYAKAIMGNDNVVIIVDKATMPYYEALLPKDILIEGEVYDIWMRDFTSVNPINPIQFKYTWASMSKQESEDTQASFNAFANKNGISIATSPYILDGGNIVDNYKGRIITTERFLEDNKISYATAKSELKKLLAASEVAIIPYDEEVLAHADGMLSWISENALLVNDYSSEPAFRTKVLDELKNSFPGVNIIEVPFKEVNDAWEGFASSTGINVNSTLTFKNYYVPIYDMPHETAFIALLEKNTDRNIIKIKASGVSPMGGSVRCLTWQVSGENANKLILAAREN